MRTAGAAAVADMVITARPVYGLHRRPHRLPMDMDIIGHAITGRAITATTARLTATGGGKRALERKNPQHSRGFFLLK